MRDSALLLDISCRPVAGDFYWLSPPQTPFIEEVRRDPGKLRIGYIPEPFMWHEIEAPVREATSEAAKLCESLGHHVEETKIAIDFQAFRAALEPIYMSNMAAMFSYEAKRRGRPITESDIEQMAFAVLLESPHVTGTAVVEAYAFHYAMGQVFAKAFETYDVLLQPTLGQLPVPVGALKLHGWPDRHTFTDALYRFMPNTQPYNSIGAPAMSVPLAMSKSGLPIGTHFAAAVGNDALLFSLAGQLEKARPWFHRVPPEFPA